MKARPRLVPGSTIVSIGVGGLGQFGLQYALELTAADVVAVDINADKRRTAEEMGADLVLDPMSDDVVAEINAFTGDEGATGVIDYVGAESTLATAASAVARKGLVVLVGLAGGSLSYSFLGLRSEAEVVSSAWGSRNELEEVLELARNGTVEIEVETHPLDDVNDVVGRLARGDVPGRAVLTP